MPADRQKRIGRREECVTQRNKPFGLHPVLAVGPNGDDLGFCCQS